MYIITSKSGGRCDAIVLKELSCEPQVVADIYQKLLSKDVNVSRSYLPDAFLLSLPFTGNTACTSTKEIASRFRSWAYHKACDKGASLYNNTKRACESSTRYISNAYMKSYTMGVVVMNMPRLLEGIYNRYARYITYTRPPITEAQAPAPTPSHAGEWINGTDTDAITNEINNVLNALPPIPIAPPPDSGTITDSEIEDLLNTHINIQTNIDTTHIFINTSAPLTNPPIDTNTLVNQPIDTTSISPGGGVGTLNENTLVSTLSADNDEKDGYTVFKKPSSMFASVIYIEKEAVAGKKAPDNIMEKYNILVRFKGPDAKVAIACFDDTHWDAINRLPDIGINDVTIMDVVYFPWTKRFEGIALALPFNDSMNDYVKHVYSLRKFLVPRYTKGAIIKKTIGAIYRSYEFAHGKSTCVSDIYFAYKANVGMQDTLDFDSFCAMLKYLGYMMKDGKVLNTTKRTHEVSVTLPTFKDATKDNPIMKRNLQLRADPPIAMTPNVSPWQVSSYIDS